jgi:methanogenic corrinoid protein MtbC1
VNAEILVERLFQYTTSGDRIASRELVREAHEADWDAEECLIELYWPLLNMLHRLYRADQISTISHHFATRILRSLIDQAQPELEIQERNERSILIACGDTMLDELAATMAADFAEAGGFEVRFTGGGVASDELLKQVGEDRPDILLFFSSAASDLPGIRALIDHLHEVNSCPDLQIVVGGGVYTRAEGLAEEIGADLYVSELEELVNLLNKKAGKRATEDQRTVGKRRRIRKVA